MCSEGNWATGDAHQLFVSVSLRFYLLSELCWSREGISLLYASYLFRRYELTNLSRGPTATPLLAQVGEREKAAGKTSNEGYGSLSLRRIGDAEELADTFVYLLGDKSTFITGAAIAVDGGLSL